MVKKKRVGAPNKPIMERTDPDGFTKKQKHWMQQEAKGRGLTVAEVKREMADWYITAIETQRGDDSAFMAKELSIDLGKLKNKNT